MTEAPKHIRRENAYSEESEVRARNWFLLYKKQLAIDLSSFAALSYEAAQRRKGDADSEKIRASLDPGQRMWDEMPICDFWKDWVKTRPIPYGFLPIHGLVIVENKDFLLPFQSNVKRYHTYLRSKEGDVVVDLCPGQFVAKGNGRGDRISTLAARLPQEALQRNTYGRRGNLHMLIANVSTLKEIGLDYRDRNNT